MEVASLPDVAAPEVSDGISEAEMEDLQTLANQSGRPLDEVIKRYAWNDNFGVAVAEIRKAHGDSYAGAEIVDGDTAWVAFSAEAPVLKTDALEAFETSFPA